MRIKLIEDVIVNGKPGAEGDRVETNDVDARYLIAIRRAVSVEKEDVAEAKKAKAAADKAAADAEALATAEAEAEAKAKAAADKAAK